MRIWMFFIAAFIIILPIVIADDFNVRHSPVKDFITINDSAVFSVNIANNQEDIDRFSIYYPNPEWAIKTEPSTDNPLAVAPNEARSVLVSLEPTSSVDIIEQVVLLRVKSSITNKIVKIPLLVTVATEDELIRRFLPSIGITASMPKEADPREPVSIKITLKNGNKKELKNVDLILSSKSINERSTVDLLPSAEKTINIVVDIDKTQKPIKDALIVKAVAMVKNESYEFEGRAVEFEIKAFSDIKEETKIKKGILKRTDTIIAVNNGNIRDSKTIRVEVPLIKNLFVFTKPEAKVVTEGKTRYLSWEVALEPQETKEIAVVTNYWYLVLLAFLIMAGIAAYYNLRSPLSIKKSATAIRMKEGGISKMEIVLNLRNITNKEIKNVEIIDSAPDMIDVEKEFPLGTMHPTRIAKHEKRGTILRWDIDNLDRLEERIITYTVRPRLSIVGGLSLPATIVKYKKNGKEMVTRSNALRVSI